MWAILFPLVFAPQPAGQPAPDPAAQPAAETAGAASETAVAPAATLPKIAVMPLAAKRVPKEMVEVLDEVLLHQLQKLERYKVIGTAEINAMLGFERMKDAAGCNETACASDIGGALGVNLLMVGSVGKLGESTFITLQVIDIQKSSVLRREQVQVPAQEDLYAKALGDLIRTVLGLPNVVLLQPAAAVSAAPAQSRALPWITAGLAVAATAGAVTFLMLASGNRQDARDLSSPSGPPAEYHDVTVLKDSFERNRLVGFIATGAAAAAALTTVVLFATGGGSQPAATVTPVVGPDGAGLVFEGRLP
jgi:TolB-like protein